MQLIGIYSLEILPVAEDQLGATVFVMDEDAMYEFLGLRAEDERDKKRGLQLNKRDLLWLGLWI
jgi:hypothetical protein